MLITQLRKDQNVEWSTHNIWGNVMSNMMLQFVKVLDVLWAKT
jgi:hypothetical protein